MESRQVNEKEFMEQLERWRQTGRGLVHLPKIDSFNEQLCISLVSIDNTIVFRLNRSFASYQDVLSWYGSKLDAM
ncbi:hypothetical protein QWY20_17425 [Alkalimonas sp. MEB108]|uniref:Uncharacterized protein n=1 Tax=Alkalimonas cellulosilytica TaxID=3058395 RepID=A0ABU7J9L2_9GAMM|nr:hypothetical protein [Alkalimonas sp. MEB108]MEE2003238.1 hypothetical protein [Alkalimonas sp. MEB108]